VAFLKIFLHPRLLPCPWKYETCGNNYMCEKHRRHGFHFWAVVAFKWKELQASMENVNQ